MRSWTEVKPPNYAVDAIATTSGWCNKKTGEIYVTCKTLKGAVNHSEFIRLIFDGDKIKEVTPVTKKKRTTRKKQVTPSKD